MPSYQWIVQHRGLNYQGKPWGEPSDTNATHCWSRPVDSLSDLSAADLKLLGQSLPEGVGSLRNTLVKGELILQRHGGGYYRFAYVGEDCRLPTHFPGEGREIDQSRSWAWYQRNVCKDIRIPNRFHKELAKWKAGGFR